MFIGRKRELDMLDEKYSGSSFEFFTVRGRRRVGKTTILKEFSKGKNVIYFSAQEQNKKNNLEKLSNIISAHLDLPNVIFNNFEAAFKTVFDISLNERLVLIIDEFPYLAISDRSLMSVLQNMIDEYHKSSKLFLILCGSSISFMENKVIAYKAPLYGRSTGQLKVEPFLFNTAKSYFENYSDIDKIILYSIFGGIPAYLSLIDNTKDIKTNIINNFLSPESYIFDEPTAILKEEFREPALYNSIIEAVATGSSKINEIATKIDATTSKTANYIKNLIELKMIIKESPVTEKPSSRKTIYRVSDNLFKFWYNFISPNLSTMQFGDSDHLYESLVAPYLNEYIGHIFEDICKEYLLINMNDTNILPFFFNQIGRWWGTNPVTKSEEEIDLLLFSNDNKNAFFIECKWKNEKQGLNVLKELEKKSELLNQFKNKYYGIFSKSGFQKDLLDYANNHHNIYLYDLGDICM